MPGLIGIVSGSMLTDELAPMESGMPIRGDWLRRRWSSPDGRVAMSCFARDDASATGIASSGSKTLALDGELYGVSVPLSQQPQHLLDIYEREGIDGIRNLEGRFVAAIWCEPTRKLVLLTDKFAAKPLFYSAAANEFRFGTSIHALVDPDIEPTWNKDGLVQFFTFGQLWNDDTFFESVRACYAASHIVFEPDSGSLRVEQYWRPSQKPRVSDRVSLERMTDAFSQSVADQTEQAEGLGVALSGGLDARTMLAFVDTDHVRPDCVSLGMEGSLDQRSAKRLAELAGCKFHSLVLGEGFLEGFRGHLERMVELTDGHYLDQCIVLPTFPLYESLGIKTLLRGHVGELLHMHKAYNFSVDGSFQNHFTANQLHDWLSGRLQAHLTAGVQEPLLQGMSAEEFRERGDRTLKKGLRATEHFDHPMDRISQLFLDQRTRRETAMSLAKFNSVVDTRTPYLNGPLIEAVFESNPNLRSDEVIQAHMLRTRKPSFLRPPNSNTGAPVGVSKLHRTLAYYRMRVFAKLGVKGYQPYERLGLWLKRELRPTVEDILLSDACLQRGLLNPDCVRNSVTRHMQSQANHTFLLMAMMAVELGMREQLSVVSCRLSVKT